MSTENNQPEQPNKIEIPQMPALDNPVCQFNRDTNTIWIGIPVHKFSPLDLLLIMDSVKTDVIGAHKDWAFRKSQLVKPTGGVFNQALQNTKNFLAGKR